GLGGCRKKARLLEFGADAELAKGMRGFAVDDDLIDARLVQPEEIVVEGAVSFEHRLGLGLILELDLHARDDEGRQAAAQWADFHEAELADFARLLASADVDDPPGRLVSGGKILAFPLKTALGQRETADPDHRQRKERSNHDDIVTAA